MTSTVVTAMSLDKADLNEIIPLFQIDQPCIVNNLSKMPAIKEKFHVSWNQSARAFQKVPAVARFDVQAIGSDADTPVSPARAPTSLPPIRSQTAAQSPSTVSIAADLEVFKDDVRNKLDELSQRQNDMYTMLQKLSLQLQARTN